MTNSKATFSDESGIYKQVSIKAASTAQDIYQTIAGYSFEKGGIFMVVGPEKSGKSIVAIDLFEKRESDTVMGRRWAFSQPLLRNRTDVPEGKIFSRIGKEIKAVSFETKIEIERLFHDNEVVVVDEIQFIMPDIQSYFLQELMLFVERGGVMIGLGLDYTSQGGEFIFPALLKYKATKVYRLEATCQMCGGVANKYCQRLIDCVPANIDTPAFLSPSVNVSYEPRCDNCFVVKK